MSSLLLALALAGPVQPPPRPDSTVRATASIVRGHESSSRTWNPASHPSQREIVKDEKDGRRVVIRLTEYE